jgi:hypothetical protein
MVVALLALGISLSGTGYAVTKLSKNSVGTKQLKKNSVTSPKVKNGSLRADDFATGALPQGPQGAQGPQGPQGPKGDAGTAGATGPAGAPAFVKTTTLTAAGGAVNDTSVSTTTWEQIKVLGTFTKTAAATGILVNANISGRTLSDGLCQYQLRVDGATLTGSTLTNANLAGADGTAGFVDETAEVITVPMTISADFGTLGAGDHQVSVWVRGNSASGCAIDPANLNQERALVQEYSKP